MNCTCHTKRGQLKTLTPLSKQFEFPIKKLELSYAFSRYEFDHGPVMGLLNDFLARGGANSANLKADK